MLTYSFIYLKYKNNYSISLSKQSWTNDPFTVTRQFMIFAYSCLIFADHMNIHWLIQNHVKFEIWIFSWFTMIMCISLYHSLILLNKNLIPASLGSPCMHTHLDENPGQEEEPGVWCGRTTHGSASPQSLRASLWSPVYHNHGGAWFVSFAVEAWAPIKATP